MAKWKNILTKTISNQSFAQEAIEEFWKKDLKESKAYTIFFDGRLGAGKSFWAREILKCSGIKDDIPSPTYTYVQEYSNGLMNFAHFDLYRIESFEEFLSKGFEEIITQPNTTCLVEWPQNIGEEYWNLFPEPHYMVKLEFGEEENSRSVLISQKN